MIQTYFELNSKRSTYNYLFGIDKVPYSGKESILFVTSMENIFAIDLRDVSQI